MPGGVDAHVAGRLAFSTRPLRLRDRLDLTLGNSPQTPQVICVVLAQDLFPEGQERQKPLGFVYTRSGQL